MGAGGDTQQWLWHVSSPTRLPGIYFRCPSSLPPICKGLLPGVACSPPAGMLVAPQDCKGLFVQASILSARLLLSVVPLQLQEVEHVRVPRLEVHGEGAATLAAALRANPEG